MLDANPKNVCTNSTMCLFCRNKWEDRWRISGLVLFTIALILVLIIILSKKLHDPSIKNTIFIITTLIIMIVGVRLLTLDGKWYEYTIAVSVPYMSTIYGIILGEKLQGSAKKWKILMISVSCALLSLGILFSILMIVYMEPCDSYACKIPFSVLSFTCWCSAMFIVMILTAYYFLKFCELVEYSIFFVTLIVFVENFLLYIISLFHVNYFFHCFCTTKDSSWSDYRGLVIHHTS
ncbi:unnamed protein product [Schistosoma turkestanicum]|nr:unnamed protein product [Schistosoma turkestanicum]